MGNNSKPVNVKTSKIRRQKKAWVKGHWRKGSIAYKIHAHRRHSRSTKKQIQARGGTRKNKNKNQSGAKPKVTSKPSPSPIAKTNTSIPKGTSNQQKTKPISKKKSKKKPVFRFSKDIYDPAKDKRKNKNKK